MTELAKIGKVEKKLPRPADILNPGLDVTASQSCLDIFLRRQFSRKLAEIKRPDSRNF